MTFISKCLNFMNVRVNNFAQNIKVESTFIKASLKDSRKVERIKN